MLTSILSGIAVAASVFTIIFVLQSNAHLGEQVRIAEREARVASERYNDIKVELVRRGIPVSDH